jgi:hypothetical protein
MLLRKHSSEEFSRQDPSFGTLFRVKNDFLTIFQMEIKYKKSSSF